MAFDTYMKIDGIPGEALDEKHKDWIELMSFHQETVQPTSPTDTSAGSGTSARVNMGDLVITKRMDKASPKLWEACCKGTHIPTISIEANRQTGDKVKYLEVKMENVIVSRVNTDATGSNEDVPHEIVSLKFAKIKWTYTQTSRETGKAMGSVMAGWDMMKNAAQS
jgi:type VI secretion system secreted protein Hcp